MRALAGHWKRCWAESDAGRQRLQSALAATGMERQVRWLPWDRLVGHPGLRCSATEGMRALAGHGKFRWAEADAERQRLQSALAASGMERQVR
mmetsp:Transcript_128123/g.369060  ORF Transcript_128123/g.369060 Transcript_128123/m.369060 type:complete len:93 (+) Transcript_128123:111-389(+)